MKSALIIFVREPILGMVKTRLAKTIGDEAALLVYKELLNHTYSITRELPVDKYVFYADDFNRGENSIWKDKEQLFYIKTQSGEDLGQRMQNAFAKLFEMKYDKLVIIGSDCYELSAALIMSAFTALDKNDTVIGPSADGGYYLLGMKKALPDLFTGKVWSTGSVLKDTLDDINKLQLRYHLLPELSDIDEEKDLSQRMIELINKIGHR